MIFRVAGLSVGPDDARHRGYPPGGTTPLTRLTAGLARHRCGRRRVDAVGAWRSEGMGLWGALWIALFAWQKLAVGLTGVAVFEGLRRLVQSAEGVAEPANR